MMEEDVVERFFLVLRRVFTGCVSDIVRILGSSKTVASAKTSKL